MADIISLLTPLPTTSKPPSELPSNTVAIFYDPDWNSQRFDLNINNIRAGKRQVLQALTGDSANWTCFNLPVGFVMTMMDDFDLDTTGRNVADLSRCGKCVDLIGIGQTVAVDLDQVNMVDYCISTYFWRTVDLNLGALELWDNATDRDKLTGNRSTIFLSEFPSAIVISIADFYLIDRVSYIRWKPLQDRQTAVLFENSDGSGAQFNDIDAFGLDDNKEVADVGQSFMDNTFSAFGWDAVDLMKKIIAPFTIPTSNFSGSQDFTPSLLETNRSPKAQPFTIPISKEDAQKITTTTLDQHEVGITATFTSSVTAGVTGFESKMEWSVSLKYEYTHSDTSSRSQTETIYVNVSRVLNSPPHSQTGATMLVKIGQLPPAVYRTTAEGEADPAENGWFKRQEPVTVTINCSLAVNTTVDIESAPLAY